MSALTINAKLERSDGGTSWGFRMAGGKDFGSPLTIQRVNPGSLADKCGLQVNDEIKVIGTTATDGLRHSEAQQLIRDSGNVVELKVERGGSTAKSTDSENAQSSAPDVNANKQTTLAQNQSHTILPKPFSSQTPLSEHVDISKSKPEISSSTAPKGVHKVQVVGGSVTTSQSAVSQSNASNDKDFPPPPPVPEDVEESSTSSSVGPSPAQSARYDEHQDADAAPNYQGYVDPALQSRSFKLLQSAMQSGEDISKLSIRAGSPGRTGSPSRVQKPAIGVKPVIPKGETSVPSKPVKPAVSQKYNTPIGLYSEKNIEEAKEDMTKEVHQTHTGLAEMTKEVHQTHTGDDVVLDISAERKTIVIPSKKTSTTTKDDDIVLEVPAERKTIVIPSKKTSTNLDPFPETLDVSAERKKIVIPSSKLSKTNSKGQDADRTDGGIMSVAQSENGNGKKMYAPSETMKLIQDQESGRSQIQINPRTGAEVKMNQSKKLIKLEQNLEGGFASGPPPPLATSYKVATNVTTEMTSKSTPSSSGKRQVNVGKAGEAKTLPAILEALKIPVCVECGSSIRGPYVTALDKTWCPDHFICAYPSCRVSLIDRGFVEEDGKLYCEHDYERHFAPKCGKCGQGIVGEVVSALQQKFHANCFICHKCRLPITGGLFHTEDDKLYCEKDWSIMFRTKCYSCQFPIDEGDIWVDAISRMWHSDCFKCMICQVNLDGESFFAKSGKPYCKKHGSA